MKIDQKELRELRKELKGYGGVIAERLGESRQAVYNVLSGAYFNEKIFEMAVRVRNENRRKKKSLVNKLKG